MKAAYRILPVLAVAMALSTIGAQAAVLTTAGNTAYVDSGQGFQPVSARTTVKAGDVISVAPGGRATLTYNNGCGFTVSPKRPVTVQHVPPSCLGGNSNNGNSLFDKIVGITVTTTVFATIAIKAKHMGHNKPASP